MGAIFGIWNRNGVPVHRQEMSQMQDILEGYGAPATGPVIRANTAFGCLDFRLNAGIKPNGVEVFKTKQDMVLVADAKIYNRDELLRECNLSSATDVSDSEILLAAYLRWGKETPLHVNGDFAFAVFDYVREELSLVSDHLGVRPLFYYEDDQTVVFATDMKAILSLPKIPREVNGIAVFRIMSSEYIEIPEDTHMEHIRKIPQASIVTVSKTAVRKTKYWTPGQNKRELPIDEEACAGRIRDLMQNAVEIRVDAITEPIAMELSGGLDSSAITVFAARHLRRRNETPECYCWAPSFALVPEQPRDERRLVEAVCEQENIRCGYFSVIDPKERARLLFGSGAGALEEELRVLSQKGIRAVFSGWGGDQAITHRANLSELRVNGYYKEFMAEVLRVSRKSVPRGAKLFFLNSRLYHWVQKIFAREQRVTARLIRPEFRKKMRERFGRDDLQFNRDLLRHLESGNIQSRTHMTAKLMPRYGIDYVFPFLDFRLVDLAFSLPRSMFYKYGVNRYIARKALRDILPEEVRNYIPKDDIVRCSFFEAERKESLKTEAISTKEIRKELFDPYIDFAELDRLIQSEKFQKNRPLRMRINRKINQLKEIQADF